MNRKLMEYKSVSAEGQHPEKVFAEVDEKVNALLVAGWDTDGPQHVVSFGSDSIVVSQVMMRVSPYAGEAYG